jgi:lipoprotein-anchoring transpeptidase ErfK/SrfK
MSRCSMLARFLIMAALAPSAANAQASLPDSTAPHIVISIADRRLWLVSPDNDTIFTAAVAVGTDRVFEANGHAWRFATPPGVTTVTAKETNPVWVPPDWHYMEVARDRELGVAELDRDHPTVLSDGRSLTVRRDTVGLVGPAPDSTFRALPTDEEIIFDRTVFIPPYGTFNRRVSGILGDYRLLLANGVGIHGTNEASSVGKAATHGCIRMLDADIQWLYENVPVGTVVVTY